MFSGFICAAPLTFFIFFDIIYAINKINPRLVERINTMNYIYIAPVVATVIILLAISNIKKSKKFKLCLRESFGRPPQKTNLTEYRL